MGMHHVGYCQNEGAFEQSLKIWAWYDNTRTLWIYQRPKMHFFLEIRNPQLGTPHTVCLGQQFLKPTDKLMWTLVKTEQRARKEQSSVL